MTMFTELTPLTLGSGTLPGSAGEALDYAMREAMSPDAQEFVGGHGTVWGLLVFVAVVLLIIYLIKNI
jgi:hypothetical protein